jgi:ubiquinone/menaquinone biosynthesis C-methylase UbiE
MLRTSPRSSRSIANIVFFDTLHHLENVQYCFDEALRVLQPGGRVIIMDPYSPSGPAVLHLELELKDG